MRTVALQESGLRCSGREPCLLKASYPDTEAAVTDRTALAQPNPNQVSFQRKRQPSRMTTP